MNKEEIFDNLSNKDKKRSTKFNGFYEKNSKNRIGTQNYMQHTKNIQIYFILVKI